VILARRLLTLGLLAAAGTSALACTSSTTATTYTPITGIEIASAPLVAGFGCGKGPGQVYRYAAVVTYNHSAPDAGKAGAPDAGEAGSPVTPCVTGDAGAPVTQGGVPLTNIFDCFADGVFENLPSSDAGSLTFNVNIFAYNYADYVGAGLPANLGCPPALDAGNCTPSSQPVTPAQEKLATWISCPVCTATQQAGTPVIAVCGPLVENPARSFETADAAADATREGAADAAPEGAVDAAPDATITAPDGSTDGGMASPDADASADGGATTHDG
jgi:hypothetical protein